MKKLDWMKLAGINLLFVVLIISPFLPGPPNELVLAMSMVAGMMGFFGMLFVPVGLIWTVVEIRKMKDKSPNWKSAYWLAVIATVMLAAYCLFLLIPITLMFGAFACALGIVLGTLGFQYLFQEIKKLKGDTAKNMNLAAVYLSTVPLTAFVAHFFLMKPASNFSRNIAIEKSQALISAIEAYKNKDGQYPENMEKLKHFLRHDVPSPQVMGIQKYDYKRNGEDYNIGFKQNLDFGLEEIVVYDKNNRHEDYYFTLKGALESHDSKYEHWRYFWCD